MRVRLRLLDIVVAVLLIPMAGCPDGSKSPAPGESTSPSTTTSELGTSRRSEERPPPDKSLPVAAYIEAGMPSCDRSWSGADMARASAVLTSLSHVPGQFPRYRSLRSGEVFRRFTADDNFDLYRNRSLPIEQRILDCSTYLQSQNEILKLYWTAFNQEAAADSELIELTGSLLHTTLVMLELVDEFLPTLDKADPTYDVRMQGFERMKNGVSITVTGALTMLTESDSFRTDELKRFAGYLQETLPGILPRLTLNTRREFVLRLRALASDPKMKDLGAELKTLLLVAEKASGDASDP